MKKIYAFVLVILMMFTCSAEIKLLDINYTKSITTVWYCEYLSEVTSLIRGFYIEEENQSVTYYILEASGHYSETGYYVHFYKDCQRLMDFEICGYILEVNVDERSTKQFAICRFID